MTSAQPGSTREVLEADIRANPDDLAAHAAYADLLTDQGEEARGEFIQIQLRLEDKTLPRKERDKLKRREKKLLAKHEREWLGPLAPILLDQSALDEGRAAYPPYHNRHQWQRGVLACLRFGWFSLDVARALRDSADRLALSRELRIMRVPLQEAGTYDPGSEVPKNRQEYDTVAFYPLTAWPLWQQIRIFQLGVDEDENYDEYCGFNSRVDGEDLTWILTRMPDAEELYLFARGLYGNFSRPMPHLRLLQFYHSYYQLRELAENESLGNLTHLLIHPHEPMEMPTLDREGFEALIH
jgi:uncharacterized protein (TIGR02996 family)